MPDSRSWRIPSTLEPMPHRGALHEGDLLAVRWHDKWKLAKHWRRERGGILAVLEVGGSIWFDKPAACCILHKEDQNDIFDYHS
jgi:hypothetical protein